MSSDTFKQRGKKPTFDNTSPNAFKELFFEYYAEKNIRPIDLAKRFSGESGMSYQNVDKQLKEAQKRINSKNKKK